MIYVFLATIDAELNDQKKAGRFGTQRLKHSFAYPLYSST